MPFALGPPRRHGTCCHIAPWTYLNFARCRISAARRNRWLHAALALAALAGLGAVAVYRADLVGMVLETFRVGPE